MSVRAYRTETKTENGKVWSSTVSEPTFNCWNDTELSEFLRNHGDTSDQTNMDGCGVICVSFDALKDAIENQKELGYDNDVLESLKADLATIEEGDFIDYDCF